MDKQETFFNHLLNPEHTNSQTGSTLTPDQIMSIQAQGLLNKNCSKTSLDRFLATSRPGSLVDLALKNPNINKQTVQKLADAYISSQGRTQGINPAILKHEALTPEFVEHTFNSTADYEWKLQLLQNPGCPLDILAETGRSKTVSLQKAALLNPNFPADTLIQLTYLDPEEYSYQLAAKHKNLPEKHLKKLYSTAKSQQTLQALLANPNRRSDWVMDILLDPKIDTTTKVRVALPGGWTNEQLHTLLEADIDIVAKGLLLSSSKISEALLDSILLNSDIADELKQWALLNPGCGANTLTKIAEDTHQADMSRFYAVTHQNCAPDKLVEVFLQLENADDPQTTLGPGVLTTEDRLSQKIITAVACQPEKMNVLNMMSLWEKTTRYYKPLIFIAAEQLYRYEHTNTQTKIRLQKKLDDCNLWFKPAAKTRFNPTGKTFKKSKTINIK